MLTFKSIVSDVSAASNIPMVLLVFIMHTSVVEDWCHTGERASCCFAECEWAPAHTKGNCQPCCFSIHTSNEVLEIPGKRNDHETSETSVSALGFIWSNVCLIQSLFQPSQQTV